MSITGIIFFPLSYQWWEWHGTQLCIDASLLGKSCTFQDVKGTSNTYYPFLCRKEPRVDKKEEQGQLFSHQDSDEMAKLRISVLETLQLENTEGKVIDLMTESCFFLCISLWFMFSHCNVDWKWKLLNTALFHVSLLESLFLCMVSSLHNASKIALKFCKSWVIPQETAETPSFGDLSINLIFLSFSSSQWHNQYLTQAMYSWMWLFFPPVLYFVT